MSRRCTEVLFYCIHALCHCIVLGSDSTHVDREREWQKRFTCRGARSRLWLRVKPTLILDNSFMLILSSSLTVLRCEWSCSNGALGSYVWRSHMMSANPPTATPVPVAAACRWAACPAPTAIRTSTLASIRQTARAAPTAATRAYHVEFPVAVGTARQLRHHQSSSGSCRGSWLRWLT